MIKKDICFKKEKELNRDFKRQFNEFNNLYESDVVIYKKIEKDFSCGEIREYYLIYKINGIKDIEKWSASFGKVFLQRKLTRYMIDI